MQSTKKVKKIFQIKNNFITCSKLIINKTRGSPIRLDNVYFGNNEQASLVFFIAHAEHNLIKLTLMGLNLANGQNGIFGKNLIWQIEKIAKFGGDLFWRIEKIAKFGGDLFWRITQRDKFFNVLQRFLT